MRKFAPFENFPLYGSLWHIDSNHKLILWKIVVHGGIDGNTNHSTLNSLHVGGH